MLSPAGKRRRAKARAAARRAVLRNNPVQGSPGCASHTAWANRRGPASKISAEALPARIHAQSLAHLCPNGHRGGRCAFRRHHAEAGVARPSRFRTPGGRVAPSRFIIERARARGLLQRRGEKGRPCSREHFHQQGDQDTAPSVPRRSSVPAFFRGPSGRGAAARGKPEIGRASCRERV